MYKCILDCGEYTYLNAEQSACVADTCTVYESLGVDGKCHACAQAASVFQPAVTLAKIALKDAEMSSQWCCEHQGMMLEAKNALDGKPNTMAHTAGGRGHWWRAQFDGGAREVSKVSIRNRLDCCGERLAGTKVYIGEKLCGTVPENTTNGTVYDVVCSAPIVGTEVVIRQEETRHVAL